VGFIRAGSWRYFLYGDNCEVNSLGINIMLQLGIQISPYSLKELTLFANYLLELVSDWNGGAIGHRQRSVLVELDSVVVEESVFVGVRC
jgi:hypothetical protein